MPSLKGSLLLSSSKLMLWENWDPMNDLDLSNFQEIFKNVNHKFKNMVGYFKVLKNAVWAKQNIGGLD